jgi:hypothetical protein
MSDPNNPVNPFAGLDSLDMPGFPKELHNAGTDDGWHGSISDGGVFAPEPDRYHMYMGRSTAIPPCQVLTKTFQVSSVHLPTESISFGI